MFSESNFILVRNTSVSIDSWNRSFSLSFLLSSNGKEKLETNEVIL